MNTRETQKTQWEFVLALLKEKGIETLNAQMTLNMSGNIVVHSKSLANCLIIGPEMTNEEIINYIEREVETTKRHIAKNKQFKKMYPNVKEGSSEWVELYNAFDVDCIAGGSPDKTVDELINKATKTCVGVGFMPDVSKIAVGVGYVFTLVNPSEVAGIKLKDTNQLVRVNDCVYSLYKGETFADSQKLDVVLDNALVEMSINSCLVDKASLTVNELISKATTTSEKVNRDVVSKNDIDFGKE